MLQVELHALVKSTGTDNLVERTRDALRKDEQQLPVALWDLAIHPEHR